MHKMIQCLIKERAIIISKGKVPTFYVSYYLMYTPLNHVSSTLAARDQAKILPGSVDLIAVILLSHCPVTASQYIHTQSQTHAVGDFRQNS